MRGAAIGAVLLGLLLAPSAGALPLAEATLFEGTGSFATFELGRNFPNCIPHPNPLDPLPGDLRVLLVHAAPADAWAVSFTFTHLDTANPLTACIAHETCSLTGDPTAGRAFATCARDVLPSGYVQLQANGDGSYAFTSFLGYPFPGGGADLLRGTVVPTRHVGLP